MEIANEDMLLRYKIIKSQIEVPEDCKICRFYKGICDGPCLGFFDLSHINIGKNG
jgi:hypothetical protein